MKYLSKTFQFKLWAIQKKHLKSNIDTDKKVFNAILCAKLCKTFSENHFQIITNKSLQLFQSETLAFPFIQCFNPNPSEITSNDSIAIHFTLSIKHSD